MNLYLDNEQCLQKVIHVPKQRFGCRFCGETTVAREYTALVYYDKQTKVARFEVAITNPKLDRFSRKGGCQEVLKKLANEKPLMMVDLSELVKNLSPKMEKKIVAHLMSDFTHEIVPRKLLGKK